MKNQSKVLSIILILSLLIKLSISGQTFSNTTIYTPNLTAVSALILTSGDYTQTQKDNLRDYWLDYYDNRITYHAQATWRYNCHAYAWRCSEGGSVVWLNDPGDDEFWDDGSYIEVSSQSEATKVSFGGPCWYYSEEFSQYANWCDHSAITTETEDQFKSKWGSSPRFIHDVDDCPYDPQDLHYYVRPYISGPSCVCSSGTEFSIENLPSGATISWSSSEDITRVSSQGSNPCEFETSENGGIGWIDATVTYNSEQYGLTGANLWLGLPEKPVTDPGGYETEMEFNDYLNIYIRESDGADPYSGFAYALGSVECTQPYGMCSEYYSWDYGWGVAYITTSNACGTSDEKVLSIFVNGGEKAKQDELLWSISPNPSKSFFDINLKDNNNDNFINSYKIEIIDSYARIVRNIKLNGPSNKIDIENLPVGYYIIKLTFNNKIYQKPLIIQK